MSDRFQILIVDDNQELAQNLKDILESNDYVVMVASDGAGAITLCTDQRFGLAMVDIKLPDIGGMELVEKIAAISPLTEYIIITGFGTMEIAVEAIRHKNIISLETKPLDLYRLLSFIRQVTERRLAGEALRLSEEQKLRVERIVAAVSSRFVGIVEFEEAITESLQEIGAYYLARRSFLFIRDTANTIGRVYLWSNSDVPSERKQPHENILSLFNNLLNEMSTRKELVIPGLESLPPDLFAYQSGLEALDIKSLVLLPISSKGEVIGYLGLDNIENPGQWTLEDFHLLTVLSNLFSNAFHRRMVEQDLIESEEIHRILLNATREGIVILDRYGRIAEVSNITMELFGAEAKSLLIGRRFLELIPQKLHKKAMDLGKKTFEEGLPQNLELNLIKDDGTQFTGEVNLSLLKESTGEPKGFLTVLRDISQRKSMEKQLIHTERMAGIGEMAAGIAHEINQPLNTISLTLDNLLYSIRKGSFDTGYLETKTTKIFENIDRMRNIIDHVLTFSKQQDDFILSRFSINESIRNAKSMVSEQFKHNGIHIMLNLDDELASPLGNTYRFEQVILNLIINSKDALEEKKKILDEDFSKVVDIRTYQDDQNIFVEVKDNGIGIESKDIDKVMLPFYSTKKEGSGTGLGLSISFGIIREMNGKFEIQSEPLQGTNIKITIPYDKNVNQNL